MNIVKIQQHETAIRGLMLDLSAQANHEAEYRNQMRLAEAQALLARALMEIQATEPAPRDFSHIDPSSLMARDVR